MRVGVRVGDGGGAVTGGHCLLLHSGCNSVGNTLHVN